MGVSRNRRLADNIRPFHSRRFPAVIPDPVLAERLPLLALRHRGGEIGDAVYAAGYFLAWQIALHGRRFASRKSKSDPRPDAGAWFPRFATGGDDGLRAALIQAFGRQHFLGVIPNVPVAFVAWLRDEWPLTLMAGIPAPAAVLDMQVAGTRPVTVIADYARALRPVLSKANGYAFLVHDLEHAYKFFHDPRSHRAQRRFFRLLLDAVRAGVFDAYRRDPLFDDRFDYLMSDMNTHVVHSLRFLGAVLIECLLRREGKGEKETLSVAAEMELAGFLRGLGEVWRFPPVAGAALGRLVRGGFGEEEAALIEAAVLGD